VVVTSSGDEGGGIAKLSHQLEAEHPTVKLQGRVDAGHLEVHVSNVGARGNGAAGDVEVPWCDHALVGLGDLVEIRQQDYRDVAGTYDAVVSVEMIEAVGEEYWPLYFAALDRLLAPGGVAAIQAILMAHDRYLATRRSYGWIQKHIFPGGLIPSMQAISTTAQQHTRLRVDRVHAFGPHYAETLRRWRHTFEAASPRLPALGFDETFRRKWEFYLAYSEAGFDSGYLDVGQIRLTRPTRGGGA